MIPTGAFARSLSRFLSPVSRLMDDSEVSEILINGPFEIWVERCGRLERTECAFPNREALDATLVNIAQYAGRVLGNERPVLEAHLPDGSRIEAVLPPLAENGPVVAIRRFKRSTLTIDGMIASGTLTDEAAKFIGKEVRDKRNIAISGGTGTGKTSLLGVFSSFIPEGERIVVIEDTREVRLMKSHVVYLETRSADERGKGRIDIRDLLRATLRLRPDRIVVGEVRGAEAIDLIQAMTSGHAGSMTTIHATSPADALRRIETMAMMDDTGLPLHAIRSQVASAVDLIVQVERSDEGARRVSAISRVKGWSLDRDYSLEAVFSRQTSGGPLCRAPAE